MGTEEPKDIEDDAPGDLKVATNQPDIKIIINLVSIFQSESILNFNFIGDDANLLQLEDTS
jgi:hypothetical protein